MIFHRLSRRIFFIGLFLLPLLFVPTIQNGFEGVKVWFFQAWVLVLTIVSSVAILKSKENKTKKFLVWLVFGYFFWNLLMSLTGVNPQVSFYGLFWRGQGLITLACYTALVFVSANIFDKRDLAILARVLVSSGFAASLFVILSILSNLWFDTPIYKYLDRFPGTFGNPNFLAGFLAIVFPLIFVVRNNFIRGLLATTFLLVIYLSGSRGAFVALALTSALFLGIYFWKRGAKVIVLVGLSVALLIGLAGVNKYGSEFKGAMENRECIYLTGCENVAGSRQRIYGRGVIAVLQKPIRGYGLENYEIAVKAIDYPFRIPKEFDVRADKAHNETLEILVASGVPGLILWFLIFGLAARSYLMKKNYLFLAALLIFAIKAQTNVVSVSEYALYWILVGFSAVES